MENENAGMVAGAMSQHEDSACYRIGLVCFPFGVGQAYTSATHFHCVIAAPSQIVTCIGQNEVGFRVELHNRPHAAFPSFTNKSQSLVFDDVRILAGVDFDFHEVGCRFNDSALCG